MESLGRGGSVLQPPSPRYYNPLSQVRAQITTEISQKLRLLEMIDKQRCGDLKRLEAHLLAQAAPMAL
jgi:hypothetical protein